MSEQRINIEQLGLQCNEVVEEACQMVLKLEIQAEEPVEAHIRNLATGVRDARTKMARVQLELNLQITELQLRAQPSTPPEVKEQHTSIVTTTIAAVDSA